LESHRRGTRGRGGGRKDLRNEKKAAPLSRLQRVKLFRGGKEGQAGVFTGEGKGPGKTQPQFDAGDGHVQAEKGKKEAQVEEGRKTPAECEEKKGTISRENGAQTEGKVKADLYRVNQKRRENKHFPQIRGESARGHKGKGDGPSTSGWKGKGRKGRRGSV